MLNQSQQTDDEDGSVSANNYMTEIKIALLSVSCNRVRRQIMIIFNIASFE